MPPKDFEELKESIRKFGLLERIIVNDSGQILDGRHRYRAICELDLHYPTPEIIRGFQDVKDINADFELTEEQYIYESNIHRRHLTVDQRVMLAAEFAPFFRKEGEEKKAEGVVQGGKVHCLDTNSSPSKRDIESKHANSTVGKVATKAGVSEYKAAQAIKVAQDPELSKQVANGEITLKDAAKPTSWSRPVSFDHEEQTPEMTMEERVVKRFNIWVADISKEKHISRKQVCEFVYNRRPEDEEFHAAVNARVQEFLEQTIMPKLQEEQAEARRVMDARKGIMDRKTYKKIWSCLHPDRVTDPEQKLMYEEAFRLFSILEKRLLDEKDSPTPFVSLPKTPAE
jgi:hypothetical protein